MKIKCNNCGNLIDANDAIKQETQKALNLEIETKRKEYKKYFNELKQKEEKINEEIQKQLQEKETYLKNKINLELKQENEERQKCYLQEIKNKNAEIAKYELQNLEFEKLKLEKENLEINLKSKLDLEFSQKLNNELNKMIEQKNSEFELKLKEKDEQLEITKREILNLQKKAHQGSTQIQGEAMELLLQEWLSANFPLDDIREIKKGVNGADCMQIVNTKENLNCGKIYYESKRTKEFSKEWIDKFKKDIREDGADIGVLVSEALPKDFNKMGFYNGIWICNFSDFKILVPILRRNLIEISMIKKTNINRQDKINLLYEYIRSNEFLLRIEAIVDSFKNMQESLDKERNAMTRIWAKREKEIKMMIENVANIQGSFQGIIGSNIIETNKSFELEDLLDENSLLENLKE